jgi:hypothetical protein
MTKLGRLPIVTESTITETGWYWFEPEFPDAGGPKGGHFVYVDQDAIRGHWLECRKHVGKYAGPIEPPDMSCQHSGPLVERGMFNNTHQCEKCGKRYFVAD